MHYDDSKVEWIEFDLFKRYPHVLHGTFQRHGGTSKEPFASLNVSDQVGDHPDCVKVNRERVRQTLGVEQIVFPHQQHGIAIVRITKANVHHTHQADALFTTEPGIALAVAHADCQGALVFDPVHQAVGAAHVGWRGNVQNFYRTIVDTLKQEIGSKPNDLLVCISPSLGPDHAEFVNYRQELPKEFWSFQTRPHYFDLWALSLSQLAACGIPEQNIEIAQTCTACATKEYFSYRNAQKTGRNATAIALSHTK
jgi:polyphenol oxidase